jgi:carboxyl-terminal processing protease
MQHKKLIQLMTVMTIISTLYPQKKLTVAENLNPKQNVELTTEQQQDILKWFRTLSEVTHLIEKKHFRKVDFSDFIQNALKSALPTTDAHSSFFPQKLYKSTIESTSGEFSGIGVSIINKAPEDESLVVIDVIQGGPSDKAGLKPADKIVEVGGVAVKGLSSDEVITKLKGKTGTTVKIKVIRQKKPLEFTITRNIIKDQSSFCYNFKNQNVPYFSVKIFADNTAKQMEQLIIKAQRENSKGIILDLRRNPGGVLDSVVDTAGLFLDQGSLVVATKDNNQNIVSKYYTYRKPVLKSDLAIFIIIDNFTASAAEILSGCLKHYSETINDKRKLMVFLVGTETFGKGSVQEVIPISNGCALKITTMLYYLPNNVSIQAKGIKPDFLVNPKTIPSEEIKWVNELYGKESSMKNFITTEEVAGKERPKEVVKKEIAEKKEEELSWTERHKKSISLDTQIQACVNMINMLYIAKQGNPKLVDTRQKALAFLQTNYLTDEQTELEEIK